MIEPPKMINLNNYEAVSQKSQKNYKIVKVNLYAETDKLQSRKMSPIEKPKGKR